MTNGFVPKEMTAMKNMMIMLCLVIAMTLSACSTTIVDTPELRAHYAVTPLPVPDLPCEDILGNINAQGEKIYHVVGGANYNQVKPEAYFCTEAEAQAAGYRKAQR
jgi:hypothetical protein